jgi:hypothetical protein
MTTKIAPPTTARNATVRVATRAGRDTSHHLASAREQHQPDTDDRASGHRKLIDVSDLGVGAASAARIVVLHDEIVMIQAATPTIALSHVPGHATDCVPVTRLDLGCRME